MHEVILYLRAILIQSHAYMEYIRQFWLQLLCPCNALFISSPLSGPLHYPPPLLFVPAFLTCSFESVIPPCFFHYLSALARAEYKKREREREFFLGRGRACTIRHSRFNLTSHLCRCETSEPAAVQAHQSGPLLGLCADSADVSRLSVVSLLSARGCKCHWRHAGGPIKSFLYVYEIQSWIFSSFSPPSPQSLLLSLRRVRISNRSQFNWDCGGGMDTSSWFTCNGFTGI